MPLYATSRDKRRPISRAYEVLIVLQRYCARRSYARPKGHPVLVGSIASRINWLERYAINSFSSGSRCPHQGRRATTILDGRVLARADRDRHRVGLLRVAGRLPGASPGTHLPSGRDDRAPVWADSLDGWGLGGATLRRGT